MVVVDAVDAGNVGVVVDGKLFEIAFAIHPTATAIRLPALAMPASTNPSVRRLGLTIAWPIP